MREKNTLSSGGTEDSKNHRVNDNIQQEHNKINIVELVEKTQEKLAEKIENAELPVFLLNTPLIMAQKNEKAHVNVILGDAGVGKSILEVCTINTFLKNNYEDDTTVIYLDLEFQENIAKERNINNLIRDYKGRFLLVNDVMIEQIKNSFGLKTTLAAFVNFLVQYLDKYPDKKLIVVIDSMEDFVSDTSNDTEVKRMFNKLLLMRGVTFIFSHHVNKDETKSASMRFRGSEVIKAKLSSMIYIRNKTKNDDESYNYEITVEKMRAYWQGATKIIIRANTKSWLIENVDIVGDLEELSILKAIYFILIKQKMIKTELINEVADKLHKNAKKVRSVIDKYAEFFTIEKNISQKLYKLAIEKIDKLRAILGIDERLSNVKTVLLDNCKALQQSNGSDEIAEIQVQRGGKIQVYTTLSAILNNIYTMQDDEAAEILESLSLQFDDT